MQKIVVALDGLRLSHSAIDYTLFMARFSKAHVVGVFIDDVLNRSYGFGALVDETGGLSEKRIHELDDQDEQEKHKAIAIFEKRCRDARLDYSVHRDRNTALQDLLHESIYADLLVIESKETFNRFPQPAPTELLRDLLSDAQCPVLVVPETYLPIEKTVILYDGEPTSVHAVKMFSYLLPEMRHMDTEVLSVKSEFLDRHLPDNRLMKEFMKRHFPNADYRVKRGDAQQTILSYLKPAEENVLVVLGAYQRSRVSRWFRTSMADWLLRNRKLPLFIAHNK